MITAYCPTCGRLTNWLASIQGGVRCWRCTRCGTDFPSDSPEKGGDYAA